MSPTIPKIIHQTWRDRNLPVSEDLPESWQKINPDWAYRFWCDSDLDDFVNETYPDLAPIYFAAPKPVMRADIARYLLLEHFGGIYADIDTRCVASLAPLARQNKVVLCEEPPEHWGFGRERGMKHILFNGVMASPAGHPLWAEVRSMLHRCRHAQKSVLDSTGPLMLTGAVAQSAHAAQIAINSCHLFTADTKDGGRSTSGIYGPHSPLEICQHLWQGSWVKPAKTTAVKRLKAGARRLIHRVRTLPRPAPATVQNAIDPLKFHAPLPKNALPNVVVMIPVRSAARHLPHCFSCLEKLEYPREHLRLVFCEGNSTDASRDLLAAFRDGPGQAYKECTLLHFDTNNPTHSKNRWKPKFQAKRRAAIARVRNHLIAHGLAPSDDFTLWIDADVCAYSPGILRRLLSEKAKLVVPNCVLEPGGASFDQNTWLGTGAPESQYFKFIRNGILQPPANWDGRRHFDDLRYLERVPVSGIGGTMLLADAALFRAGLRFPETPYRDLLETEALGVLCCDLGLRPIGLPNVEIRHVAE